MQEQQNSTLELLKLNNQEVEELLGGLGEFFPEECILEKLWIRELEEDTRTLFLIHCPRQVLACIMNIRNKNDLNSAAIALTRSNRLEEKGK